MTDPKNASGKSTLLQYAYRIWTLHIVVIAIYLFFVVILDKLLGDTALYLLATIVCTLLFACLSYSESWRVAARDRNLVLFGHIEYNKYKGLLGALCSQAPGLFFALLAVIVPSFTFSAKFVKIMYVFLAYPVRLLEGSFSPVFLLPALVAFISMPLGYALGYKEFRILSKLIWRSSDPNKPKKERKNLR